MGFSVFCHGCGKLLFEGQDMIPLYRLRRRTDGMSILWEKVGYPSAKYMRAQDI